MMRSKILIVIIGFILFGCQQNKNLNPMVKNRTTMPYLEIISKDNSFKIVSKSFVKKQYKQEIIFSISKSEADDLYFRDYQRKSYYNKKNIKNPRVVILTKDGKKAIFGKVVKKLDTNKKIDFVFLKNEKMKFYDYIKYLTPYLYKTAIAIPEEPYASSEPVVLDILYIFGLVNNRGEELFPPKDSTNITLYSWENRNIVSVHTPKKGTALYNSDGTIFIPFRHDYRYSPFVDKHKYIKVIKGENHIDYFGYMDLNGKEVVPAKYRNIIPLSNGLFRVSNRREGLYLNGKEIVPCVYSEIYLSPPIISKEGKVKVKKDNGKIYWFNISSQTEEIFNSDK